MIGSICVYSFIPVRSQASERSEMETQILFGETFTILEKTDKWIRVRVDFDDYEGWVDSKLVHPISDREYEAWKKAKKWIVPAPFVKIVCENSMAPIYVSAGSEVVFNGKDMGSFSIGNREYYLSGSVKLNDKTIGVKESARTFLNASYLWGGRHFLSIDCSGLTQVVMKLQGVKLPRNASQQMEYGDTIGFVEEADVGDLAFFGETEGAITHVGMCLGRGEIIHASGEVRIDRFDHQGIFNSDLGSYTHKLRIIKRVLKK